jgi:heptosyltransferase-2
MALAAQDWKRVLVRSTGWLGDAIMSLPALSALHTALPQAELTLLGPAWLEELFRGEPFARNFLVYPKTFREKLLLRAEVRERGFDAALLLQNAFEAAAFAWAAAIPERIGYARDGRGWLLTQALPVPENFQEVHERFYYLELLRRAGLIADYPREDRIVFHQAPQLREKGLARWRELGLEGPVIGVSPGAAFGTAKRWYPERFGEAAETIARSTGAAVALFGSPSERELAESIAARLAEAGLAVRNLAGQTTLREFLEFSAACALHLTNDSGAMHVAYATGTPSVTVFGPTDWTGTGPVGPQAKMVRHAVPCAPCKLRECPIDHRCMKGVRPEQVVDVALELLAQTRD